MGKCGAVQDGTVGAICFHGTVFNSQCGRHDGKAVLYIENPDGYGAVLDGYGFGENRESRIRSSAACTITCGKQFHAVNRDRTA